MKYNKILFIGFRCVGKTSFSEKLSKKIKYKLYDTDKEIEKEQKKTIKEISENGRNWENFRKLELIKLKELLNMENIIISAGGGVGVNNIKYNNTLTYGDLEREEIIKNKETFKILLIANEETIKNRLYKRESKQNNSPDLGKITNNMNEYIENNIKIMKEREENYKKMADIIFDTGNSTFKNILDDILKNVNNFINKL